MRIETKHKTRWSFLLIVGNIKYIILQQQTRRIDQTSHQKEPVTRQKELVILLTFVFVMGSRQISIKEKN